MSVNWISGKKKQYLKLQDLVKPIQGYFVEVEQGTFSPIFFIRNETETFKILGCKDLNNKMREVPIGSNVIIQLDKLVPLKNGNSMSIAKVGIITNDSESQIDDSVQENIEDEMIYGAPIFAAAPGECDGPDYDEE